MARFEFCDDLDDENVTAGHTCKGRRCDIVGLERPHLGDDGGNTIRRRWLGMVGDGDINE